MGHASGRAAPPHAGRGVLARLGGSTPVRADVVSLVEAAYLRNDDLQSWLENLVRVADAALSGGRGVFGIIVEHAAGDENDAGGGVDNFSNRANVLATSYSGMPDRII